MSLAHTNIDRQLAAIQNLYQVLETQEYKDIVARVSLVAKNAYKQRVLMAGVGKNANIASKIAETMASLGIPAMPLNVSHMGHGDFGYVGPNDVVIHISRSGTTREMLIAIDHLSQIRPDVVQVLIHCKPTKPKNRGIEVELCIGAVKEGDEFGLAPTTSTTALLCILDCISVEASHNAGFKRFDFLKFHPDGALGDMLKAETTALAAADKSLPPHMLCPTPHFDKYEPGQEFK
jgi:D-arabinose 5-phosphate isomerase GutQ